MYFYLKNTPLGLDGYATTADEALRLDLGFLMWDAVMSDVGCGMLLSETSPSAIQLPKQSEFLSFCDGVKSLFVTYHGGRRRNIRRG